MGPSDLASKACHNCRRRRIRCDRAVPACQKCAKYGQECLGYGKLFVWNNGVASRGKMMGKTFPLPKAANEVIQRCVSGGDVIPVSLSDPLYQGLDDTSRRYLFHFATNLSGEMAICDITETNPFRSLVPLCQGNPMLLHAINANAALHVSCLHRRDPTNSSQAMVDALSAKHKSLGLLQRALEDIPNIDIDITIAVAHLFIIFELISPVGDEWRAHVHGALQLINYLQTIDPSHSPVPSIRDTLTSDCLTYYVLGNTLTNTGLEPIPDPFLSNSDIIASLTRAEPNSYLSLPTPLLQLLFRACELSNLVSRRSTEPLVLLQQANTLLRAAEAFDAYAWASHLQQNSSPSFCSSSPSPRTQSRIHIALAHQAAVKIYILRSVDTISPREPNTETLVTEIVAHLSLVSARDPVFMATCWPSFIAGAETRNPGYREWAVQRLRRFWELMPWGYVKTAEEVMRTTWELRDRGDMRGSWIQQVKGLERCWLIA
ncbi:fungal-specific transcription factor domain-containing protein [Aspergillus unguis]